jgi:predicted dehydrogenase
MSSSLASISPLRVGFVGCGRATEILHIPALAAVEELQTVAASDPSAEAVAAVRRAAPGIAIHASYRDLVADPSVDVVAVCVPPALHAEVALAALAAGKHVYLEKPIAVTLSDAAAIRAAAEGARSKLALGFNLRSHRLVAEARSVVEGGLLGKIELVRTAWTCGYHIGRSWPAWRYARRTGGGAFYEIAVHHLDLLAYLLADEIESVVAASRSDEVEDQDILITVRTRSGVLGSIAVSQRTTDGNEIAIYGQRGALAFSCYRADSFDFRPSDRLGGGLRARLGEQLEKLRRFPRAMAAARAGGDFQLSYRAHWRRFALAIRDDLPLPATVHEGERALRAVIAAIRSVETGSAVTLDDVATPHRDVDSTGGVVR